MNNLLFIKISNSSFVQQDEELLSKHFNVTSYISGAEKGFGAILNQFNLFIFLLINIWKFKIIYIWFADYHSLMPTLFAKILSKKSFIVLGGFDVAKIEKIKYGAHTSRIRSHIIKLSCKWATQLLAVSNYVLEQAVINISPNILNKTTVVYNGVNTDFFKAKADITKESIISICGSDNMARAKLKGVYHFIDIAKKKPEYNFILVGIGNSIMESVSSIAPNNLKILGSVNQEQLKLLYTKSLITCQFSTIESFGLAVAEAMSCGCIPVVSNKGGLKEVVGNTGYLVDRNNYEQIITSIDAIYANHNNQSDNCIKHAISLFSIAKRETTIISLLKRSL